MASQYAIFVTNMLYVITCWFYNYYSVVLHSFIYLLFKCVYVCVDVRRINIEKLHEASWRFWWRTHQTKSQRFLRGSTQIRSRMPCNCCRSRYSLPFCAGSPIRHIYNTAHAAMSIQRIRNYDKATQSSYVALWGEQENANFCRGQQLDAANRTINRPKQLW